MKSFKKIVFFLLFFVPFVSQARITDGKDHLKLSKNKIVVTLEKGFHFVMQSPAGLFMDGELGSKEPVKKEENQMVFDVSKVGDRSFSVSYYVCDNQRTVCESHESHLKLEKGKIVRLAK